METEDSILVKCCNLEIVPHNSDTHVELLLGENWDHSSGVNNWIPQIFASAQHIVYDLLNFWLMKYWSLFGNTEKGKKKNNRTSILGLAEEWEMEPRMYL